jgi:hypothetical protein
MRRVTREQAEAVLHAVRQQYGAWLSDDSAGPELRRDWDGRDWVVLWEEGPYEWSYAALQEHVEPEMYELAVEAGATAEQARRTALLKEARLPDGVWVEAVNHYSLAVYPD